MLSGVSAPFSLSPRVNPQIKSRPLTSPPPPPPPPHHHHALRQCHHHHHRLRLVTTLNCSSGESAPSPEKKKALPLPWSRFLLQFTEDGEKHDDSNASYNKTNTSNNTVGSRINDSSDNAFLRYYTNSSTSDVAAELKTSIVTYKKMLPWRLINPKLQVDLVSAVHIADRRYFEILQERLGTYDCVLYEGVGDRDEDESHSENDMKGFNFTSFLQRLLGWSFSIDFQLDCLNYKFPNWYNADLDWETFQRLQKERGENFLSVAGNALTSAFRTDEDSASEQSTSYSLKSKLLRVSWFLPMPLAISMIINETCSPDTDDDDDENKDDFSGLGLRSALKVFIARSLTSMFASDLFAEMEEDSVIIGERNKKALEELKKAISKGEKRVAIFYGAGHMPDMGRRLRREFNMVPTDVDWVTAWSIIRTQRTDSKFFTKIGQVGLYGLILCILLLDLWLWWSAANVAYHTGFQMVQFMLPLVIM